jgi:hypothetical protein
MYLYRRTSSWPPALRYVIRKTGNEQNKMRHRSANEGVVLKVECLLAVKDVVKTVIQSSLQLVRKFIQIFTRLELSSPSSMTQPHMPAPATSALNTESPTTPIPPAIHSP